MRAGRQRDHALLVADAIAASPTAMSRGVNLEIGVRGGYQWQQRAAATNLKAINYVAAS